MYKIAIYFDNIKGGEDCILGKELGYKLHSFTMSKNKIPSYHFHVK